jgi:opacity protein-like surface antigen
MDDGRDRSALPALEKSSAASSRQGGALSETKEQGSTRWAAERVLPRQSLRHRQRSGGESHLQLRQRSCVGDSRTKGGSTVGAGLRWALWDDLSFKAQYLHVDFGTTEFINPPVVGLLGGTFVTREVPVTDLFRVRLDYRLGWRMGVMC